MTSAFGHIFDEELKVSSSRKKGAMGSHCNTFLKDFKPGKKLDDLLYEDIYDKENITIPITEELVGSFAIYLSKHTTKFCKPSGDLLMWNSIICTIYCAYFRFYIYHTQPLQTKCVKSSSHYHIV